MHCLEPFLEKLWDSFGEEFRTLRTKIVHTLNNERNKVILVTSAAPREGKTTVAINLARAFSLASYRTLLIDSDMWFPDVHTLLGIDREPGLSDILKSRKLISGAGRKAVLDDCDVLTAGASVESPMEMITAAASPLIKKLSARYDYLVIDSPPLLPVADSLLLSRYSHGILMVVNHRKTLREVVKSALEQVSGSLILGLVLNGLHDREKYYSYYYE